MKAAIVRPNSANFSIEDIGIGGPRDDEILVNMKAVGICHSDISCRDQIFPAKLPQVFGHEGAGVVESVGASVKSLQIGDHVVLTFNSCGECANCDSSMPAYCYDFDRLNVSGGRPDGSSALSKPSMDEGNAEVVHGHFFGQSSFAEFSVVNERNAVKIDKSIDLAIAAPFGCAVQTGAGCIMNTLKPTTQQSILIVGTGGVGLSAIMAASELGCHQIIAVDLVDHRLSLATQLGATHTINASSEEVAEVVRTICPLGVDYSVECSGAAAVLEMALTVLSNRGVCVLLGVPGVGINYQVPCYELNIGRTVRGVVAGDSNPHDFLPLLFELFKQGKMPVDRWISKYPFDQINQAADDLVAGSTVKPVLVFD